MVDKAIEYVRAATDETGQESEDRMAEVIETWGLTSEELDKVYDAL